MRYGRSISAIPRPATFGLLGLLALHPQWSAAQCPNDNILVGTAITVPCPGTYTPAPCLRGGRYVLVNVTSGRTYTFATCGGNVYDTYMTVYTAAGVLVASNDNTCGTQSAITWTATFTGQVRVLLDQGTGCNTTGNGTCATLNISCVTASPVNDLICNATVLPVNTNCTDISPSPTNVAATTTAGPPAPGCANYVGGDIWFRLTVPAGGAVSIQTSSIASSPLRDLGIAAYSSSNNTCTGTLSLIWCNDDIDFPYNTMSYLYLSGLTPGATIFIRAWENGNNAFGPFNICASITPPLPDERCTAQPINVGEECIYTNYSNAGSTRTTTPGNPGCGFSNAAKDIWFRFTAPANGNVVIQSESGTLTDGGMALYSSSNGLCSGTFNLIECDDDDGAGLMPFIYRSGLTPGASYWIRYWGYGGATGTFQLCLFSPTGNRPEDCLGGYTVCDNQEITNTSLFTGFTSDLGGGNQGCLSTSERQGLWYVFSIASGGQLGFTLDPIDNDDYDFAIWGPYPPGSTTSSICAPTSAPIRCSYASGANTFGATGSYNTGMGHPTYSPPRFANPTACGTCSENSGGDGWISGLNVSVGQVYVMYISNFSQSGSAFQLSWTLLNGASLACTVLPVELLSLSGEDVGSGVSVSWTTLTEHHSDYFVVERSADGEHFAPIGTVGSAGESMHRIDYEYLDTQPLIGANYYRLKQVDLDGAYEHTPAIVVFFGKETPAPIIFPNPAMDLINVAFEMPRAGTAYAQVIDMNGRVVRDRDIDLDKGPRTFTLNILDLPSGSYELRLFTTLNSSPQNVRFMKP